MEETSFKETRIRALTQIYYSRSEVQKAIFEFSKNREISPRYFEGFGKRPDTLEYPGDVFALVKKGATSFHCSEELWEDPLKLSTEMTPEKYNQLRIGWDLLIDIDCKWIDYSKLAAQAIINVLESHGIKKSYSIKFSGSKGFHIFVPFQAFPKEIAGEQVKNLFPELPRILVAYIRSKSLSELEKILPEKEKLRLLKNTDIKRGIKCNNCGEIADEKNEIEFFCNLCKTGMQKIIAEKENKNIFCPNCKIPFVIKNETQIYSCDKCEISSKENPSNFSSFEDVDYFEVMGLDLVLVSPRHLFRMPYSLHEKTALASVVLSSENILNFDFKDANPLTMQIKNFYPEVIKEEAKELVTRALDWAKEVGIFEEKKEKISGKYADFKPLNLTNLTEEQFPPCIKKILQGLKDGRKRGLFVLIHFFRSLGLAKEEMEKKIYSWNEKNEYPLQLGYIKSQLSWAYKRKPLMPQNCREFYKGLGVCLSDSLCDKIKNPVNYTVRKNFAKNKK